MRPQITALALLALALACDAPPDPCESGCETTSTGTGETTDTTSETTSGESSGPSDTTETGEEVSTFVCCSCLADGSGVDNCVAWPYGADDCQIDQANAEGIPLFWCALVDGEPVDCESACLPQPPELPMGCCACDLEVDPQVCKPIEAEGDCLAGGVVHDCEWLDTTHVLCTSATC